jgi:hypothetical protein
MKFKNLKEGDFFGLSEKESLTKQYDGYLPYINVKVTPSVTMKYINEPDNGKYAFNAIAFEDGRVRTFHPDAEVYKYEKEQILLK